MILSIVERLIGKLRKGCLVGKPCLMADPTMEQKRTFPIWTTLLVLGALGLAGAVWAGTVKPTQLFSQLMGKKNDFSELSTKVAEKKSFLISLAVQGNLDSLGNNTLYSEVEGTTTIISIEPQGKMVQKGDVVCQLDAAPLREKAKQQEITITQADSAESKANETLEITKTQSQSDIAAAELKRTLAKLDLKKFVEGEFPQQQHELQGSVEIAKEEMVRASETYDFTKQQVKKGYRTQNEMEANRIAVMQAKLKVKGAEEKLSVLEKFTKERTIAELEANATELELELTRIKLKCSSAETQATKDYEAMKLTAAVEHEKYDRLKKQIDACTMKAPIAGQVVYAIQSSNFGRSSGESIEQGATVRERQAIISLPDVSQMKVDCRIHESLIGNIRKDLPARIKIDSFPDQVFKGVIADVSSVPLPGRFPNMDLKEYEAEIKLVDDPELINKLRPGLTAQVEIMVDNREDVLQIPVQAVLAVADKQMAYVLTDKGVERRELVVGQSNQSHVEIKSGIEVGEKVVMNSRSQFGEEISRLESELNKNRAKDAPPVIIPPAPTEPPVAKAGGPPGGGGQSGNPAGGAGAGTGPGRDPAARFAQMDKNSDGKLTTDEVDERMKDRVPAMDKDGDGAVSQAEYLSAPRPPRTGGPEGSGGPPSN